MGPKKDVNKPKGAMTSYAAFVQVCSLSFGKKKTKKMNSGKKLVFMWSHFILNQLHNNVIRF